jgi:hypothetical protein
MRISFDLDDTLICYRDGTPCEPRLWWPLRWLMKDEPLRRGARELAGELRRRGHELWIYTTSHRRPMWVRLWLRAHGIRVGGVVNGERHARCFGECSSPSKRPHAFEIDLHVDDSRGVAMEGEAHGFNVCVIDPGDADWASKVLAAVDQLADARTMSQSKLVTLSGVKGK